MKKPATFIILAIIILALASTALTTTKNEFMRDALPLDGYGSESGVAMPAAMTKEATMIAPDMGYPSPYQGGVAMDSPMRYNQYFASYGLVVQNTDEYFQSIKSYVTSVGGVVLNSSRNKTDDYTTAYLTAKVPVARFEETTRKITEGVEDVMQESVSSADVTGQVVNHEEELAKLKTKKIDAEEALTTAKTDVEKRRMQLQIDALVQQIDSYEQMLESTQEQIEYATIDIQISDDKKYFEPFTHEFDFQRELERALRSMRGLLTLGLVAAIWATVYSVVLIPLWFVIRWLRNKMMKPTV